MRKFKILLPIVLVVTVIVFAVRTVVGGAGAAAGLFSAVKN